jgi:hypothetical protein
LRLADAEVAIDHLVLINTGFSFRSRRLANHGRRETGIASASPSCFEVHQRLKVTLGVKEKSRTKLAMFTGKSS